MSLLFDQNLSRRLPALLAAEFPGSEQVLLAGLARADDRAVWAYAAARGLAVVSKDADFRRLSAALGPPPKVVWLRVGNGPTRVVEAFFGRGRRTSERSWPILPWRCSSCRRGIGPEGPNQSPRQNVVSANRVEGRRGTGRCNEEAVAALRRAPSISTWSCSWLFWRACLPSGFCGDGTRWCDG